MSELKNKIEKLIQEFDNEICSLPFDELDRGYQEEYLINFGKFMYNKFQAEIPDIINHERQRIISKIIP